MHNQIRVAIIDDHPLFRDGVVSTLSVAEDIQIVAVGASGADSLRITQEHLPDIMLLDISMPGGGIETARSIANAYTRIKIIMLTVSEREDDVLAALAAGASGYILKGITGGDLVKTVRAISNGETYITPQFAARLLSKNRSMAPSENSNVSTADLSNREDQVLHEVIGGLTNKEIARKLNLSEKTVKHYMTSVLHKLGARNRVEAVLAHLNMKG